MEFQGDHGYSKPFNYSNSFKEKFVELENLKKYLYNSYYLEYKSL